MCHLMPRWHLPEWRKKDERAFAHCGSSGLNYAITSLSLPQSFQKCHPSLCSDLLKMQLTVAGIVLSMQAFIWYPTATVYKCPLILFSPLGQMPPWHQVAHAIAIPSGIISLCIWLRLELQKFIQRPAPLSSSL